MEIEDQVSSEMDGMEHVSMCYTNPTPTVMVGRTSSYYSLYPVIHGDGGYQGMWTTLVLSITTYSLHSTSPAWSMGLDTYGSMIYAIETMVRNSVFHYGAHDRP